MKSRVKNRKNLYINSLSFQEVDKIIKVKNIEFIMQGDEQQKFSIGIKKFGIYLFSILIPLIVITSLITDRLKSNYFIPQTTLAISIELLIMIYMTYLFFYPYGKYLQYWGYEQSIYSMIKLAYISVFVMGYGMDEGSYTISFLVVTICIITFLFLYNSVEENMIIEEINALFDKQYKTSKTLSIVIKLSGLFVGVIFIAMQLYRINKWWLVDSSIVAQASQSSSLDDLIGVFIGIPMLLLLTLIPTYFLFRPKTYVEGKILSNYAENFREQYGYTNEEWYEKN